MSQHRVEQTAKIESGRKVTTSLADWSAEQTARWAECQTFEQVNAVRGALAVRVGELREELTAMHAKLMAMREELKLPVQEEQEKQAWHAKRIQFEQMHTGYSSKREMLVAQDKMHLQITRICEAKRKRIVSK